MNKNFKILIVEGETDTAEFLKVILENAGYEITAVVNSSSRALEAVENREPDLILIDVLLQGNEDGINASAKIGKISGAAIVLIVNKSDNEAIKKVEQTGEFKYITKPVKENELISLVESVSEFKELNQTGHNILSKKYLLDSLMDSLPDIICFKDKKLRFMRGNKSLIRFLGAKSEKEIIGKTVYDFLSEEAAGKIYEEEKEIIETGIPLITKIEKLATKDGIERWINSTKIPLKDENGKVTGLASITHDITSIKLKDEEIQILSAAVSAAGNGIVLTDIEGIVWFANPAFCKMTGFSLDEIIGNKTNILKSGVHPQSFYTNMWDTILAGKVWKDNIVNKKKSGELYTERMTITPVVIDNKITHFLAIKSDITEEILNREKLEKNSQVFEALNELHSIEFAGEDELIEAALEKAVAITDSEGGYLHFVNDDNSLGLFKWSKSIEKICDAEKNPHYPLKNAGIWADCIRAGKPIIHNDYANSPDKKGLPDGHFEIKRHLSVPVFDRGKIVAVCGVGNKPTDYTDDAKYISLLMNEFWKMLEKIRIEKKLKESEERFRGIFENTSAGIYRSTPEGKIILLNPAMAKILGYSSPEEFMKENPDISKIISDKDREEFIGLFKNTDRISQHKSRLIKKDGSIVEIMETSRIVRDENNNIKYFEGAVEDITFINEARRKIEEAKKAAENSAKFRANILSSMSHEIRTPVNNIVNFASFIKEECNNLLNDETREGFDILIENTNRLVRTMDLILNVSDADSKKYKPTITRCNLDEILIGLKNKFGKRASEKNIKFNLFYDTDDLIVKSDEYSLELILENLIDNAINFTEKGSVDVIVCKDTSDTNVIIKDTGIGISEEYLEEIFEPFTQEDMGYTRKYEGSGLGMTLVKKFCELNNIDIGIESEKGAGTEVTLKFRDG